MTDNTNIATEIEERVSYRFAVTLTEKIEGFVSSPHDPDKTLEILKEGLEDSYGDGNYEVTGFEVVSDEEVAAYIETFEDDTPRTLN